MLGLTLSCDCHDGTDVQRDRDDPADHIAVEVTVVHEVVRLDVEPTDHGRHGVDDTSEQPENDATEPVLDADIVEIHHAEKTSAAKKGTDSNHGQDYKDHIHGLHLFLLSIGHELYY